jgi:hypothetical protein
MTQALVQNLLGMTEENQSSKDSRSRGLDPNLWNPAYEAAGVLSTSVTFRGHVLSCPYKELLFILHYDFYLVTYIYICFFFFLICNAAHKNTSLTTLGLQERAIHGKQTAKFLHGVNSFLRN